jgi:DNA-binding CsgD family transcriptional regulator
METLAPRDLQNLQQSIQQLYSFHDLATFRLKALEIVNRLVESDFCACFENNLQTHQFSNTFLHSSDWYTPELHRVSTQSYSEHPIVQNMPQTLTGAYKISDFINLQKLHYLEGLYQQYLGVMGMEEQMTLFLSQPMLDHHLQPNPTVVGFALQRSECSFIERDRSILNLLRPHVSQAYTNALKYQQLQQNNRQLQQSIDCLGAIIIDAQGRIKSISTECMLLLETYFIKATRSSELPDLLWSWVKYQVNCCTKNSDSLTTLVPFRIQQAGRQLVIRLIIEKVGERYLLLLEEQSQIPSWVNSIKVLGLSDRETEVLEWVIQGKDNKSIAIHMKIRTSTVRKHLENIYRKLGVQNRTEASAKAIEKLGFVNQLTVDSCWRSLSEGE